MKKSVFDDFWKLWTNEWLKCSFKYKEDEHKQINSLCHIKPEAGEAIYGRYCKMKETVKSSYFYPLSDDVKINRYKRAAVLSYVVLKSDPLIYDYPEYDKLDVYFLKQRLAFL